MFYWIIGRKLNLDFHQVGDNVVLYLCATTKYV